MEHILFDSDIIIWYLRGKKDIIKMVDDILYNPFYLTYASTLTYFEVKRGARKKEIPIIDNLFSALSLIPVSEDIAKQSSNLYQKYSNMKNKESDIDLLIAGTAIYFDMIFLTLNKKHFQFKEIKLYSSPR